MYNVYGIWNLDFFRTMYQPFCLYPDMPMLTAISLDYMVALYPIVFILITYAIVSVCDKYTLCCRAPLQRVLHQRRKVCDFHNTLIDVFITMLILSYVKVLNTSIDLLLQTSLLDKDGEMKERVVYYNRNWKYFGIEHLPYSILALVMSLTFSILPLVILSLYQCQCFQKCLNRYGTKLQSIHIVMDTFYKSYKTKPKNCRYFAIIYLYLRIINVLLLELAFGPDYFSLISILYFTMAVLIGLIQPYKVYLHNVINAVLFSVIGIIKILETAIEFSVPIYESNFENWFIWVMILLYLIPPTYGFLVLAYNIVPKKVSRYLVSKVTKLSNKLRDNEELVPHHIDHVDEYSSLITFSD